MTDYEKTQIRLLQEKGYGYKKIATTLAIILAVCRFLLLYHDVVAFSTNRRHEFSCRRFYLFVRNLIDSVFLPFFKLFFAFFAIKISTGDSSMC